MLKKWQQNMENILTEMLALKWAALGDDSLRNCSYDEWKKNLKKENE